MWDRNLVREILEQVLWSVRTVSRRFALIQSPDNFMISDEGLEKLDAICMQLLAIGESIARFLLMPLALLMDDERSLFKLPLFATSLLSFPSLLSESSFTRTNQF